jgi:hypothetical protein
VEDMQADFNAYGEDYTVSIIEEIDYSTRDKEYEWMCFYNSNIRGFGYNYKDWVANHKLGGQYGKERLHKQDNEMWSSDCYDSPPCVG